MIGELSPTHWLIVAVVFVLLFGAKKLPDASRSLGRSLRIFKSEVSSMKDEFKAEASAPVAPVTPQPAATPPAIEDTKPAAPAVATPATAPAEQPKA